MLSFLLYRFYCKEGKIWILSVVALFCLLMFCGCGDQGDVDEDECLDEPAECRFTDEGLFLLRSLDLECIDMETCKELDATLIEMPFTGRSGNLVLWDKQENHYRFEPVYELDWQRQLDRLQLGKTYHFVFAFWWDCIYIHGIQIFDEEGLLYLAETSGLSRGGLSVFSPCNPENFVDRDKVTFWGTDLQGFAIDPLTESPCCTRKKVESWRISLVTSVPMLFQYGDQTATLYQSQEAVFITPYGNYLVHVLRNISFVSLNYDGDGGDGYSFYVKRL
jgi:hypothetical protein